MTTSFRELLINFTPWIRRKLFDRQTHLPVLFVECYNLRFMNISQLEKFFCVHRCVSPCNFTYVNKTFNTWLNLEECTIIFNVDYFTFNNLSFLNSVGQHFPGM